MPDFARFGDLRRKKTIPSSPGQGKPHTWSKWVRTRLCQSLRKSNQVHVSRICPLFQLLRLVLLSSSSIENTCGWEVSRLLTIFWLCLIACTFQVTSSLAITGTLSHYAIFVSSQIYLRFLSLSLFLFFAKSTGFFVPLCLLAIKLAPVVDGSGWRWNLGWRERLDKLSGRVFVPYVRYVPGGVCPAFWTRQAREWGTKNKGADHVLASGQDKSRIGQLDAWWGCLAES